MRADRPAARSALDWLWLLADSVPPGRVATYGQLGRLSGLTARQVGRALATAPSARPVPWHRVLNASGRISLPADQGGAEQRRRLTAEAVNFSRTGLVSLKNYGWPGPALDWWLSHGLPLDDALERLSRSALRTRPAASDKVPAKRDKSPPVA